VFLFLPHHLGTTDGKPYKRGREPTLFFVVDFTSIFIKNPIKKVKILLIYFTPYLDLGVFPRPPPLGFPDLDG